MREDSVHRQVTGAVSEGWVEGGAFLGSILSGTLLGWLADRLLGTDPWFVVIGIIVGSVSGFYRMWALLTREDRVERP
jgi:F0F1-type ATP synthase assembly protein I